MEDQQTETTLPGRFRQLADSHGIIEDGLDADSLGEYEAWSDSVYSSAVWTIATQAATNVPQQLEHLLHQREAPKDDHDLALVLALFIYSRHAGDGAQIVVNGAAWPQRVPISSPPAQRRGRSRMLTACSHETFSV